MTKSNSKKIPVVNPDNNESKSLPPTSESKEIFSAKKHSMDYVTVNGVILRTGYHDKTDWYLLCIKELLDNAIDFLWKKYQGASDATINVDITIDDSFFHIKIRNTNSKNFAVFQNLSATFDYDMRYGSKQNQHIISRGMLGDAMKQILAWPYVLIHTKDDGSAFRDEQWDKPLIIRSNGIERHVFLSVDKANQTILADPKLFFDKLKHTDTEIEATWPIIDEVKLDIHRIERFCRQYIIFTTDIAFKFKLIDNSTDKFANNNQEDNNNNEETNLEEELVKTLTSPARKAAIKVEAPRFHPIAVGWKNKSSVHSYMPEEFSTVLTSVYNKQGTTVYDVLKETFKDGTNMKKDTNNQISITQLIQDPNRHEKIEALYYELKNVFASKIAKTKLSLPYSISSQKRKEALIERVTSLFPNQLDSNKAVYKIIHGNYNDDELRKVWSDDGKTYYIEKGKGMLHYPFAIEIIAIPYHADLLNGDINQATQFIGSVNYSISPRGNIFEGDYTQEEEKQNLGPLRATDITGILSHYGFRFSNYADSKIKLPCVIVANLISPRVDYHGHDKSRIDTHPFPEVIIEAAKAISEGVQTYRAAGYTFSKPRRMISYFKPQKKKYKAEDVLMEYLTKRKEAMGL